MNGWMHHASCKDEDPDFWFPDEQGTEERKAKTAYALALCADCPVRADCLDYALRTNTTGGIFGGMTPAERRRLT